MHSDDEDAPLTDKWVVELEWNQETMTMPVRTIRRLGSWGDTKPERHLVVEGRDEIEAFVQAAKILRNLGVHAHPSTYRK